MAFIYYNPNPKQKIVGDCTIRAISLLTNQDWIETSIDLALTSILECDMIVTPAAVEEYFNVSRAVNAQIWAGCCETVTIRNTSAQPILVQNANVIFSR